MQKSDIKHLATKEDIAKLEAKLTTNTAKLKTEIEKRARLTTMWMVPSYIALYGVLFATLVVLLGDR